MSSPAPSPPVPPAAPQRGSEAAELALFSSVLAIFVLYHAYYFGRHRLRFSLRHAPTVDLWTTALESRVVWAEEIMQDKHEGLLGVQTMRNVIVAATLMVMAMAQVLGRLLQIITTPFAMQQLDYYVGFDPIAPVSFASPAVKVGLCISVLLLSFGAFAQSARLAVHMSFMLRVAPQLSEYKRHLEVPLREELVALTHRVSLCFTLALRLLFLWGILLAWCFGITAFVIFGTIVMSLVAVSDFIPTQAAGEATGSDADGRVGNGNHARLPRLITV